VHCRFVVWFWVVTARRCLLLLLLLLVSMRSESGSQFVGLWGESANTLLQGVRRSVVVVVVVVVVALAVTG
jgi:hypothetical protein